MLREDRTSDDPTPVSGHVRSADRPSNGRSGGRHRLAPARSLLSSVPVRLAVAGVTCGLGLIAFVESRAATQPDEPVRAALADRAAVAERQPASRSSERAERPVPPPVTPSAIPAATPMATPMARKSRPAARPSPKRPARPAPVAGLTREQMDNAAVIVRVGREMGVSRRGRVVAIATAMQESDLYNLANEFLPESLNYPHQGTGADHDSVGLFQQRPSSGWGAVADLMRPAYAAQKFYEALLQVPGWEQLSVTVAAQTVQVSAFPDAYAQHEQRATEVVDALT